MCRFFSKNPFPREDKWLEANKSRYWENLNKDVPIVIIFAWIVAMLLLALLLC